MTVRVLLVDDHQLVRAGLAALLDGADDIEVVGEAADGRHAVELAKQLRPAVILMDLSMPILDGSAATRHVLAELPNTRIVILTSFADRGRVGQALEAGAIGYLLKDCDPRDLLAAVRSAALGHAPLDPRVAVGLLPTSTTRDSQAPDVTLSAREQQVLQLIANGYANKQIGRALGISEHTVKVHVSNVFRRIGVNDRTTAALWARDHLPD